MGTTFKKRLGALLVGAAMTMTAVSASVSGTLSTVWAAGKTVTVNKELPVPIKEGKDVLNLDAVTYKADVKDLATSGLTSLQFNFSAAEEVSQFQYYFGIALDAEPWWAATGNRHQWSHWLYAICIKVFCCRGFVKAGHRL